MTDTPPGAGFPGDTPDPEDLQRQFQQLMGHMQHLFTAGPSAGPVNWDLARQVATNQVESDDPGIDAAEQAAVADALRLADLWLDPVSSLPSGLHTAVAWRRVDWLTETIDVWRKLCDPVAARMGTSLADLVPPEAKAQFGQVSAMLMAISGAMFGGQLGTALGKLAAEVLSASDIGLPLSAPGTAALVSVNIAAYGGGLELPADEVRLYVALREAAHQRLFEHVPWLRGHVLSAVDTYAAGITVNREAIEEAVSRIDPANPESMQELNLEGLLTPEDTPQQKAALGRLETVLALIEGWVTHVVDAAIADRLPSRVRLSEAFRRRRAAGGPAEQTFAALVGLELRPRRLREAAALWAALEAAQGVDGRDAIWGHPDLLPSAEDFADPAKFVADAKNGADYTDLGDIDFGENPPAED